MNQNEKVSKYNNIDSLLQEVVYLKNRSEVEDEFPVTLFVKGLIICGDICSASEYVEPILGKSSNDKKDNKKPLYIHLKNIQIFTPNQLIHPFQKGNYWRGKLSSVDGFSFGKIIL